MKKHSGSLAPVLTLAVALLGAAPSLALDAGFPDAGTADAGPTPLSFVDPESTPVLCPGQSGPVMLKGQVPADVHVTPLNDAISLSSEQRTAEGWQAVATVKPHALPGTVFADVGSRSLALLQIGCSYRFQLSVNGGDLLTFRAVFARGSGNVTATGEWKRGPRTSAVSLDVQVSGKNTLRLTQRLSTAEAQAAAQAMEAMVESAAMKRLDQRSLSLIHTLQTCAHKPPAQVQACMAEPQAGLQDVSDERRALMDQAQAAHAPSMGCAELTVHAEGERLTGDASQCVPGGMGDAGVLSVKGTFTTQVTP